MTRRRLATLLLVLVLLGLAGTAGPVLLDRVTYERASWFELHEATLVYYEDQKPRFESFGSRERRTVSWHRDGRALVTMTERGLIAMFDGEGKPLPGYATLGFGPQAIDRLLRDAERAVEDSAAQGELPAWWWQR